MLIMVNVFLLGVLALSHLTAALVTLQTIREVTNVTKDATAEIIGIGLVRLGESVGVAVADGSGRGQVRLGTADEDDGEVEDVSFLLPRALYFAMMGETGGVRGVERGLGWTELMDVGRRCCLEYCG
jgi:hypothetical protein